LSRARYVIQCTDLTLSRWVGPCFCGAAEFDFDLSTHHCTDFNDDGGGFRLVPGRREAARPDGQFSGASVQVRARVPSEPRAGSAIARFAGTIPLTFVIQPTDGGGAVVTTKAEEYRIKSGETGRGFSR
jgi:hypothetical protein